MNALLERRYRFLLSLYPNQFRAEHEDAMLDCFAQTASPSQWWPSRREAVALLAGAVRARGRARVGSPSSQAVWASGLRVGAFLALGIQMGLCVMRWDYDWSYRAVFLTDKPQSQLMTIVFAAALVAALPLGRRARSRAAWATAVLAFFTTWYSAPAQFPSPYFELGLWLLLPLIAGLCIPAVLIVRSRDHLDEHNPWALPLALIGPLPVGLAVVAADWSTINVVQVTPYALLLIGAVSLSPWEPRLAIACTVAILPLALLELGQGILSGPFGAESLAYVGAADLLTAVGPFVTIAAVAINRTRAWEKLHTR